VLDLNTVGESLEGLLHRLLGDHIELVGRPNAQRVIQADIVNLAVNARDATPRGGVLPPETAECMLDDAFVRARGGARPSAHVVLG
jgi:hypothetical protein